MRTAILTFQDADNYGAALQAYALKSAVARYSDVDVINYYNDYFHRNISGTGVKSFIKKILTLLNQKKRHKLFSEFQTKYLVTNQCQVRKSDLIYLNEKYDIFITGSDQVWNLECSGNDTSYFLDFVNGNSKNSYAASFGGTEITDENRIKNLLSDYKNISVRESSGKQIIKRILNIEVPIVMDPTFLLSKKEWSERFDLNFKENYVLVYEVLTGNNLFEQAKAFAKSKGLEVICITATNKPRLGCTVIKDAGPIEWLHLMSGAAYVFTNSFHGLAFSINFEKQFFVELLPPPAKTNVRMTELLETVNLQSRSSTNANKIDDINYKNVRNLIKDKVDASMNYLISIFKE